MSDLHNRLQEIRDITIVPDVAGKIDRGHAARSELALDLVATPKWGAC